MNRRHFIAITLAAVAAPEFARSGPLPVRHLRRMADGRTGGFKQLSVGLVGQGVVEGRMMAQAHAWRFDRGERSASLVVEADGQRAQWVGARSTGQVTLLPPSPVRLTLSHLFAYGDTGRLAQALGVDRRARRLGLLGHRICHVLGADRPGQASELWFAQTDFRLLRVRQSTQRGAFDLRLDGWDGPLGQGVFPEEIRWALAGRRQGRLYLDTLALTP